MFVHQWSIGLARLYALEALEDEIRRSHSTPRRPRRHLLRKAVSAGLRGAGQLLSVLGDRLATRPSAEPRPLGCG